MIKIVNGDLMEASESIIAHQVNCMGVMGSGVAKCVRQSFPEAYTAYVEYVANFLKENTRNDLLGRCHFVLTDRKVIGNLFGQLTYGRDSTQYTKTMALYKALVDLRHFAESYDLSVALPYRIGSDRGGADWTEVYKLIDKAFDGYEVTLYKL
ncbi:macro domain-containing protein [Bacillus phage vB_BanS-Thrax1]|nr:macro domain-containing protein [Bacillus phage vB_BanS-Thrax1]